MLSIRPVSRNENSTVYRPKTPGRTLKNENTVRLPPATVNVKGKNVMQTPFQSKSTKPQRSFKEEIQLKDAERPAPRPFLDKTPFPNRIALQTNTQTPFGANLSVDTPDSLLRPSSTRKHIRVPRTSLKYETPLNTKNHWDLSDDELGVPIVEEAPKLLLPEDDYDEVEYMAPNTLDLPYQPPFDFELPNYKNVGKRLLEIARSGCIDDELPPPELEPDTNGLTIDSWETLPLPPLEDEDPFHEVRQPKPPTRTTSRPAASTKAGPSSLTTKHSSSLLANQKSKPIPPRPLHLRTQSLLVGPSGSSGTRSTSRTSTSGSGTPASSTGPSQLKGMRPASVVSHTTAKTKAPVTAGRTRTGTTTTTTRKRVENSSTTSAVNGIRHPVRPPVKASTRETKVARVPTRPATSASTYRPAQAKTVERNGTTRTRTGARTVVKEEKHDVDLVKFNVGDGEEEDFLFDI